jgi:hypothetical protein
MHPPTKRESPVPLAGETGLGEHLEETVRRIDTTDHAVGQATVSVAGHRWHQQAMQVACFAVTLAAGRHPHEVAAEVAARALQSLRSKRQPEGQARP